METIQGSKLFKGGNYMKKYGLFCLFCFSGEEAGQSGQKSMPEPMISHLWSHILETLILRRLCLALSSSQ